MCCTIVRNHSVVRSATYWWYCIWNTSFSNDIACANRLNTPPHSRRLALTRCRQPAQYARLSWSRRSTRSEAFFLWTSWSYARTNGSRLWWYVMPEINEGRDKNEPRDRQTLKFVPLWRASIHITYNVNYDYNLHLPVLTSGWIFGSCIATRLTLDASVEKYRCSDCTLHLNR